MTGRSSRARADARYARQPQQPHRRAAHPARLEAAHRYAVIEIGANHPGEDRGPRQHRAAHGGASSPTPAPSTSKASAASRASRAPKGEMFAALDADGTAVINADDRSRTCGAAWPAARSVDLRHREPADFRATRRSRGGAAVRHRVRAANARTARGRSSCSLAGRHNVMNALARRPRPRMPRAPRSTTSAPLPCHNARRSGPIAVQARAQWRLDRRRLLQRESQLDEGRHRGAGRRSPGGAGW